ncbi:TonB-dependent receptor [Parabacteroides goldsteinii]|uniref:TonB-dependent receptor n=1 Tax=Parabacteroides goldsteinii TaxID=328812 RepID=UPI0032B27E1D
MKLAAFCLTCFLSTASAGTLYSQSARISLDMRNASVEQVLQEIEESSEFYFMYNSKLVNVDRKVNIKVKDKSIETILNEICKAANIEYSVNDKQIILRPKGMDANATQQKTKTIKGIVNDQLGPITGANVSVNGTTIGTITDMDGRFTLEVPENATLQVSFIGYLTQNVKVEGQTDFTISMKEDTQKLDEVVVIGYGTQKKMNLTGSVATISAENIATIPVSNISNAMAGRMPGIFSYNKSGMPGVSSPITIRGVNTPNNTNPTYVIDGVVREKADFDALDPNTIENISVLKDAASAAVYGSRAANGVIVVSTKRGKNQKPQFSYSGLFGTERSTRKPEVLSAYDRTVYLNNKFMYNGIPETDTRYYTDDEQEYFKTHSTDWVDLAWRNPFTMQHNLSVNGGSERINYYMSIGYFDQSGTFDNLDFQRYSFRSNVDAKVADNFTIGLDVDGNMGDQRTPYWPYDSDQELMNDMYRALLNFPSTEPAYVNGKPNATIYNWNVLEAIKNGHRSKKKNTLNTKLSANWDIPWVEGLTANAMFNYRRYYENYKTVGKAYTLYMHETSGEHNHIIRDDASVTGTRTRTENGNFVRKDFNETSSYTLNLQLNYNHTFGKHDIGAMFLYEQFEQWGDNFWAQRKELLSPSLEQLFAGSADSQWKDASGNESEIGRIGYVGRVNYGFDNRYLLEANFRYDSSVKWIPGKRWGFFPSVSAGWRITEENFFKSNEKLSFINNLKLRASYGTLGNDGGDDVAYYQYLSKFNTGSNVVFGSGATGILPGVYPSRGITWETTTTADVGFDLGLWNGLLSLEFDYFHKKTKDILMARTRTIPETFGASLPKENYAEMVNQGCEFLIRHDNKIGNFNYYVSTNFSFARNHYTKIDESANAYEWELKTGRPINFITGYIAEGIARTDEDLVGLPKYNGGFDWSKGDVILKDIHGAGGVGGPDGIVDGNDKAVLSLYSKDPEIIYGISLGGEWKGLDFTAFFQGVGHRSIMFPNRGDTWTEQTVLNIWSDAYSPDNINGKYPRVGGTGSVGANSQASTFWLMNGNYFRCKNIEIGYTLPKQWMSSIGVDRCRLYVSGTNLFVLDHIGIYDPENSGDRGAYQYPLTKSFNFGINVSF